MYAKVIMNNTVDLLKRLKKIEGQTRGLQKMVEEGRYCADILTQISSVEKALRSVARVITRSHLETCVTSSLRTGNKEQVEKTYNEIMKLLTMQL